MVPIDIVEAEAEVARNQEAVILGGRALEVRPGDPAPSRRRATDHDRAHKDPVSPACRQPRPLVR